MHRWTAETTGAEGGEKRREGANGERARRDEGSDSASATACQLHASERSGGQRLNSHLVPGALCHSCMEIYSVPRKP